MAERSRFCGALGFPGLLVLWLLAPLPGRFPARAEPQALPGASASAERFAAVLEQGDLQALQQACLEAGQLGQDQRLRALRQRLLSLHPAPAPLPVVLANAEVLLACRAPEAALEVLQRYGPAPGAERQAWLLLQWRAAAAALDHRRASLALVRLAELEQMDLERLLIPVQVGGAGAGAQRLALDLLIEHWRALGLDQDALRLARNSRQPGRASAERLGEVLPLLAELPPQERQQLLESSLEQAAAAGAWGLVAELLDRQIALQLSAGESAELALSRRLRLSPSLDDAYGEWQLRRRLSAPGPGGAERRAVLELQLRSPRGPGGHASQATAPDAPTSMPPSHVPAAQP